jgi:RNA polymerase sigma-70 factor (ECF subfamily)
MSEDRFMSTLYGLGGGVVVAPGLAGKGSLLFNISRQGGEGDSGTQRSADTLTQKKDLQCVERALKGDSSAFRELVERYERRAFAIALSVIGNPDDAKDIAQEAFLKVFQKLESFKGESSFYTWLYRIVFNLAIDLSRKRYRTREIGFAEDSQESGLTVESVSESEHSGKIATPSEASARSEISQSIKRALEALSPEHRAVITLRELDGLSYTEIADVVGVSKGTIMSRLHHARKRLQRALSEFQSEDFGGEKSRMKVANEESSHEF